MAFEMKCYRRILPKNWQQKITNIEIRQRFEIKRNVVQMIMKRELKLFRHIYRLDDNCLVKDVVFGIMDGQTGEENRAGNVWTISKNGVG